MPLSTKPRMYRYKGELLTIKEIASRSDTSQATLYQRLKRKKIRENESVDDLCGSGRRNIQRGKRVRTHCDISLPSAEEKISFVKDAVFLYGGVQMRGERLIEFSGLPLKALYYLLHKHKRFSECKPQCVTYVESRGTRNMFLYHGDLMTVLEIALWVNTTPNFLYTRFWHNNIKEGDDVSRIADQPPQSRRLYLYGGSLKGTKKIAELSGVTYSCLRAWFRVEGFSHGDDVTAKVTALAKSQQGL